MPLYYFHISDGEPSASELGAGVHRTPAFWAGERWRIWVTDKPNGAGPTLLAVEVSGSLAA
jgi:hypothetical protein